MMKLMAFSLRDDFLTPKVFRILAAAELVPTLLASGLKHPRRPSVVASLRWDSQNTQAALAKIVIRSKAISSSL